MCCRPACPSSLPPTDALSSSASPNLGESVKDAASDIKDKAKSVLKGSSALPNSIATLADQNADVRSLAEDYRDPAIATPQDKVTGAEPQGCLGVETAARVVAVAGGDTGFNAWFNARQATCGMIAWQCCSHACLVAAVVLHPCACSE